MDSQTSHLDSTNCDSSDQMFKDTQFVDCLLSGSLNKFIAYLETNNKLTMLTREQYFKFETYFKARQQNQQVTVQFLKSIVEQIKLNQTPTQKYINTNPMNSQKQYPILYLDPELSSLRVQILHIKIPSKQEFVDSIQTQDLQSFLLIMKSPKKYQEMFDSIKQLVINIIENQNNHFLAIYTQFIEDYRQNYSKRANIINQSFKKQQILKILKKGASLAQMVLFPQSNLYGLKINHRIYINFYKWLFQFKSLEFDDQRTKLFKVSSALTLFKELTHYLIKEIVFPVENNYSFVQPKQNSFKKQYEQFKNQSEKITFKSLKITLQDSKLILKYKEIIQKYLQNQKWAQQIISTQLLKGKSLIFKYLLSNIFKLQVIGPQLERLLNLPNIPNKSDTNNMQSKQNNPTSQMYNFSVIINAFISHKMNQDQKLRDNFELLKSKKDFPQRIKQSFKKQLTQRQLDYILTQYSQVEINFKENLQTTEEIEKQIQELYKQTIYSEKFEQFQQILTYLKQFIPNKIQALSLYQILISTMKLQPEDFSFLIQNKKAHNQFYYLQKLQNVHINFTQLIKKCDLFQQYVGLSTILKHQNRESGWIIQERLFKELHKSGSIVFSTDWDILLELSRCNDPVECGTLRSQFGGKYLPNTDIPRVGVKMAANRQGFDSHARGGLSAAIPLNSCYHFQRLLREKL